MGTDEKKRKNVGFFTTHSTHFNLRLYGVRHIVKDHSDSERGNPLPTQGLLFHGNRYFKTFFRLTLVHNIEYYCISSKNSMLLKQEKSFLQLIQRCYNIYVFCSTLICSCYHSYQFVRLNMFKVRPFTEN